MEDFHIWVRILTSGILLVINWWNPLSAGHVSVDNYFICSLNFWFSAYFFNYFLFIDDTTYHCFSRSKYQEWMDETGRLLVGTPRGCLCTLACFAKNKLVFTWFDLRHTHLCLSRSVGFSMPALNIKYFFYNEFIY